MNQSVGGAGLPTRRIGELSVSALGLGCMGMSLAYGVPDAQEARRTIDRALALGVTLFDTADMYGRGANEEFVGSALGRGRARVTLATKVGIRTWPVTGMPRGVDGRPAYLRRAVDASLRRLRTDRLDLLYLHRVDPRVPVEESIGVLAEAVTAGKARYLGISEADGEQLRRAHTTHPIAALQSEWSIFSRDLEADALPVARELGVALVPYSPLGRGMLTGAPTATTRLPLLDFRRTLPRWRGANLATNLALVDRVRQIGSAFGATPGQVALAWLLAQGPDVVPIPGTKRVRYVEENCGAVHVHLDDAALAQLSALRAAGDRYAIDSPVAGVPADRRERGLGG